MQRILNINVSLLCSLALFFAVHAMPPMAHAADASASKESLDDDGLNDDLDADDGKKSNGSDNSIQSKVERLGKIKRLKVVEMRATQRNGLLHVQATLLNGRLHQDIVYRTKWLDKDGFSVWDDEPWKPLAMYARQKQNLLLVAPTPKAMDFRIELQRAPVHEKAQK